MSGSIMVTPVTSSPTSASSRMRRLYGQWSVGGSLTKAISMVMFKVSKPFVAAQYALTVTWKWTQWVLGSNKGKYDNNIRNGVVFSSTLVSNLRKSNFRAKSSYFALPSLPHWHKSLSDHSCYLKLNMHCSIQWKHDVCFSDTWMLCYISFTRISTTVVLQYVK